MCESSEPTGYSLWKGGDSLDISHWEGLEAIGEKRPKALA